MQFHFHANQSHFLKNDFALRLALKQRPQGTRKWPIMTKYTWATKQLHSHRDPTIPCLRMKFDMNSYKGRVNLVHNDSLRIVVAKKYLEIIENN